MKNIIGICLAFSMLLMGCTWSMKKRIEEADDEDDPINQYREEVVTPPTVTALEDIPVNPKIVRPDIVDHKASIDISKYEDQTIEVQFISMGYKRIVAKITAHDPQANLRFSRIIFPNDESDGPFGRELDYNLPTDGEYSLEITENSMAGEPWAGDFTVDFELFY